MCKACQFDGKTSRHTGRPRGPDRKIDSRGYVQVRRPDGPYPHGWILEHRLVTGALKGQVVHHKDGDRQNNQPANLRVFDSPLEHRLHHLNGG